MWVTGTNWKEWRTKNSVEIINCTYHKGDREKNLRDLSKQIQAK